MGASFNEHSFPPRGSADESGETADGHGGPPRLLGPLDGGPFALRAGAPDPAPARSRRYAALRKELIAACRSLAEADGPERPFYSGLEETVKPWLNLRVLDRTDREILSGLLLHCREVEGTLSETKWWKPVWPRHWRLGVAIVACAAGFGGLVWLVLLMADLSMLNTVRDAADVIWLTIKFADYWTKLSAIAVLIVVAAIYTVFRSVRP